MCPPKFLLLNPNRDRTADLPDPAQNTRIPDKDILENVFDFIPPTKKVGRLRQGGRFIIEFGFLPGEFQFNSVVIIQEILRDMEIPIVGFDKSTDTNKDELPGSVRAKFNTIEIPSGINWTDTQIANATSDIPGIIQITIFDITKKRSKTMPPTSPFDEDEKPSFLKTVVDKVQETVGGIGTETGKRTIAAVVAIGLLAFILIKR